MPIDSLTAGLIVTALPFVSALLLVMAVRIPRVSDWVQSYADVVAPFFVSVGLLFSLFVSFLMYDIWIRGQDYADSHQRSWELEAGALNTLRHFATAVGSVGDGVQDAIAEYSRASVQQSQSPEDPTLETRIDRQLQELIDTIFAVKTTDPRAGFVRAEMLRAFRSIVDARAERAIGPSDQLRLLKWSVVLILGVLTQVSLIAVHVVHPRAISASVTIFTLAFAVCMSAAFSFSLDIEKPVSPPRALTELAN